MTVEVIDVTREELHAKRQALLDSLGISEEDLRTRVRHELATREEWLALEQLDEIAFLLGEQE